MPCDAEMIQRVFVNLLLNAAQAMEGSGQIEIEVRSAAETSSGCTIKVRDSGPGVPVAQRDTLFEPFVTTKSSGTGLGLSIARRLVELHGGRLALADPEDGWGAVFEIELPLTPD